MPLISSTPINNFFASLFRRGTSTSQKAQDSSFASVVKSEEPTHPHPHQNVTMQRTRKNDKSLFFRTPSFLKKIGKSTKPQIYGVKETVEQDVDKTLEFLQKDKAKLTLQVVWETSTDLNGGTKGTDYQNAFYTDFREKVNNLNTSQLNKLYKNLNSKEMLRLRGGLQLAVTQGLSQKASNQEIKHVPLTKSDKEMIAQLAQEGELAQEGDGNLKVWQKLRDKSSMQSLMKTQRNHLVKQDAQLNIFKETSGHLEQLNRIVSDLMNKNRGGLTDYSVSVKPLASWKGNKKVAKLLQDFSTQNASFIYADSGNVSDLLVGGRLHGEMKEFVETLCYDGEHKFNTGSASIGVEDPNNKNSQRLNVSNQYITDFHRGHKEFIFENGERITQHDTKLRGDRRKDRLAISNHMVDFCNQNANQAQRVNGLMSQETLEPFYSLQEEGVLGTHPKADAFGLQRRFVPSEVDSLISAKQMANGDIQVHLRQSYRPMFYSHFDISSKGPKESPFLRKFYVDEKKSFITMDAIVNVPKEKSAKPQLQDYTYAINITEGNPSEIAAQVMPPSLEGLELKEEALAHPTAPVSSIAAQNTEQTNEQTDTAEPITISNQSDV